MNRIYLDWNIITNLLHPEKIADKKLRDEFKKLKIFFEHPDNNLILPYSNAHLKDLMKSFKKGEKERVDNSLQYISELSKDMCLAQYWNEENAKWHQRNPFDFFNSILNDESSNYNSLEDLIDPLKEYGLDKMFDSFKLLPHGMDFEMIEKQNPFFSSLFPQAKQENTLYAALQDTFKLLTSMTSSPTIYKELRKIFKEGLNIDPNISNFDNVVEQLDAYLPKTMLNKSFSEIYELNNKTQSKNRYYDKIIGVYMQLDFVGYHSDKINRKNIYDNIFNDALHCFYAAHCDIYLTNDKKNYKKSQAVFESEKIGTQVYKTSEFLTILNAKT